MAKNFWDSDAVAPAASEAALKPQIDGGQGTNVGIVDENLRQIDQGLKTVKDPSAVADLQSQRDEYVRQRARLVADPAMARASEPANNAWWNADKPAAQQNLPAGVAPSTAGAGRGSVNPAPVQQSGVSTQPQTAPINFAPDTDPLATVTPSTAGNTTFTATATPDAGAGRGFVNPPRVGESIPQSSGSLAKDLAINVAGGAAGGVAGAGAALAEAAGASDTAASLDEIRKNWQGLQKESGGDTIPGKAASLVGAVAPAFLVPAVKAAQLVTNAGLFAIPAFRDTLKSQLDEGKSFPLALAHASEDFGINLFLPTVATRGSGAVVKALGAADTAGAKGAVTALGQAAGEGAAFSAASSVAHKATDTVAGAPNDKDWIDLQDMAASALGFTALRGAHVAPQLAGAIADRAGSPSQQFGRALAQDTASPAFDQRVAQDRIDRLRAAGEDGAADLLDKQLTGTKITGELGSMGSVSRDPKFQAAYRAQRMNGAKPAEAAARASMTTGFDSLASAAEIPDAAVAAAHDKAADLPLDKVPGFFERFIASITSKGLGKPLPAGTVDGAIGAARDQAVNAALDGVYSPAAMLEKIKRAADAKPDPDKAARAEPDGRIEPTFDTGNDIPVTGEQPAPGFEKFALETGTAGIPRAELPQVQTAHHGPLVNFLEARGISHETTEMPATDLKPAQAEFSPERIGDASDSDRAVLVSSDGYVLDGHHQWLAKRAAGEPVRVIRLNAPIADLIDQVKEFPSARTSTASEAAAQGVPNGTRAAEGAPAVGASAEGGQPGADRVQPSALPGAPDAPLPVAGRDAGAAQVSEPHESLGATGTRSKSGDRARSRAWDANPFMAFLGKHGISIDERSEFAPGPTEQRKAMVQGYGPIFRRTGEPIDTLAHKAIEEGFLPIGETEGDTKLRNMITSALGGERIIPQYAEGAVEADIQRRMEEMRASEEDAVAGLSELAENSVDVVDQALDDKDIPWDEPSNVSTEAAMRAMGFSDKEIEDEVARESGRAQENSQGGGEPGTAAGEEAPGTGGRREGQARSEGVDDGTHELPAQRAATEQVPDRGRAAAGAVSHAAAGAEPDRQGAAHSGNRNDGSGSARAEAEPTGTAAASRSVPPDRAGSERAEPAVTWERRPSGTLAVTGDPEAVRTFLTEGGIGKMMIGKSGVLVGKTEADKAEKLLKKRFPVEAAPAEAKPLTLGIMPGNAEPVTVKDGVVHIGKAEAINFDTGEAVKVKDGASDADIKQALKDAGALSRRQKFFGGDDKATEGLSAPTKEDVLAQQRRAEEGTAAEAKAKKEGEQRAAADAQRGDFKLAGSDRAADSNPDQGAMFSRGERTEPFYSALSREVDGINAKAQPAMGWLSQVQGLIKSGKVKADEVEWTGLNDWLKLQSGKVTKEQVTEFLKNNGVQVKDVTLGGDAAAGLQKQWDAAADAVNAAIRRRAPDSEQDALRDVRDEIRERLEAAKQDGGNTKYGQYTLPGGTNYREVLLTLPLQEGRDPRAESLAQQWFKKPFADLQGSERDFVRQELKFDGGGAEQVYRSSHFDEPNILAHIRLNDRTDADGKKVLFVEEIQSDWAQQGKKQGFQRDLTPEEKNDAALVERTVKLALEVNEIIKRNDDLGFGSTNEARHSLFAHDDWASRWEVEKPEDAATINEWRDASKQTQALRASTVPGPTAVPNAPFVGKTDAWVSLAIKRIVKMAVDEGYDKVAFVNGEQSADRYGLSKQIGELRAVKNPSGSWHVEADDKAGSPVIGKDVMTADLPDVVGKELAQKIVDRDGGIFKGLDLKVGGEGMKAFYDKIVPSVAKDVIRKMGGEGLNQSTITTDKEGWHITPPDRTASGKWMVKSSDYNSKGLQFDTEAEAKTALAEKQATSTQQAFDITPAMREKAAGGVPLFKRPELADLGKPGLNPRQVRYVLAPALRRLTIPHDLRSIDEARAATGADIPRDAKGMYYKGTLHVFTDNVHSPLQAEAVFWHEVQHAGMDAIYGTGSRSYEQALRSIASQNEGIREAAKAWMVKYGRDDYHARIDAGATHEQALLRTKLQAVDEALAEMSSRNVKINGLPQFIAKVQEFLRSIGLERMANWLESHTNSEALTMILGARAAVMGGEKGQGSGQLAPAFSKSDKTEPVPSRKWPDLAEAFDRYENGGDDARDLHATAENLLEDDRAPESIRDAAGKLRTELDDEREYGGRNDTAGAEDAFVSAVEKALGKSGTGEGSDSAMAAMQQKRAENPKFSHAETTDEAGDTQPQRKPYTGFPKLSAAADFARGVMHDALLRLAPMSATDNRKAQAAAQNLANENRVAQDQARRATDYIVKEFTLDERRRMWDAGDAENEQRLRAREDANYVRPEGVGLDSLTPAERTLVERLHERAQETWDAAKADGVVEGEGVPFWTPRMLVTIGDDGSIGKLSSTGGGPRMATARTTRLSTDAGSLKNRKYRTAEETEAAASALAQAQGAQGAKIVRDIAAMPMAMARTERAIAGRRLVNELKMYGQATGEDIVRDGYAQGYETIPHPAFTTYRPHFTKDEQGKTVAAVDQDGNAVMDRVPLYIRSDWIGPLRAVTDVIDNKVYSGFMLLKSKMMSGIVGISPLIHQMVIFGGAMGYSPSKVFSTYLYWRGHSLQKDGTFMRRMVGAGVVPIGQRSNMMDVTDLAKPLGREGGWGDPNESWISLSARAAGNAAYKGLGDKLKSGMDKLGDVYHGTLLWNRIQDLQAGIFDDAARYFTGKGLSPKAADIAAAHFANRYAGVIANENMGALSRIWANVVLFSRSFTLGNIAKVKDIVAGLPAGLKAKLYEEAPGEGKRADMLVRAKAAKSVVTDVALGLIMNSIAQDLWDHFKKDKSWSSIEQGYVDRFGRYIEGLRQNQTNASNLSLRNLTSTGENEPDKKDRVDLGPDIGGRHEYGRLPTGKVPEDIVGWLTDFAKTFRRKLNPMISGPWEAINNDKGFGVPVHDPDGSWMKAIGESVLHIIKRSGPSDVVGGAIDVARGTATDLDKEKLAGNMTGFTVSQGHPGGPEAAVAAKANERFEITKKYTMQQVKDDLKHGDEDKAIDRMMAVGMSKGEINAALRRAIAPSSGLSKSAAKRFDNRANESERKEMDLQQRR